MARLARDLANSLLIEDLLPFIQRFTVFLYNRTSNCLTTNEFRKDLFCKGRTINNITPTSTTLFKHVLWSSYIARYVYEQSIVTNQVSPDPEEWAANGLEPRTT